MVTQLGVLALVLAAAGPAVLAIDCFKCTSVDGSEPLCEDDPPFDANTGEIVPFIERKCMYGFFEGTHCYKLVGKREDGTRITVRDCADDDWGSHCGDIRYYAGAAPPAQGMERITGCLEACSKDGCNASPRGPALAAATLVLALLLPGLLAAVGALT